MDKQMKFWAAILASAVTGLGGGAAAFGQADHKDMDCREKVAVLEERINSGDKKTELVLEMLKEIKQDIKDLKR